jgi:hypothetical protein
MPAPSEATDWDALSLRLVFGLLTLVAVIFLVAPTLIVLITSFTASILALPAAGLLAALVLRAR